MNDGASLTSIGRLSKSLAEKKFPVRLAKRPRRHSCCAAVTCRYPRPVPQAPDPSCRDAPWRRLRRPLARRARAALAAPCADGARRRRRPAELEQADRLHQAAGLVGQAGRGRRRRLDQRGVLLRHLVHVGDGRVDLVDADALLARVVEISCMMMVTCLAEPTTCSMVAPALRALTMPALTLPTEASISCLMSLAALALRWARLRTSPATTEKPRPCSPARAA